jgi:hypothetical protein
MNSREFVNNTVRDAFVIDAIRNAEIAMSLTNGCAVRLGEIQGVLCFEGMIANLRTALFLLGAEIDDSAPLRHPIGDSG